MQIDMWTVVIWSKSKPELEFQHGGRLGEFNGTEVWLRARHNASVISVSQAEATAIDVSNKLAVICSKARMFGDLYLTRFRTGSQSSSQRIGKMWYTTEFVHQFYKFLVLHSTASIAQFEKDRTQHLIINNHK